MFAYEISTGVTTCIAGDANVWKDARIFDGTVIYESINGGVRIVDVYTNNSYSISDFSVNKIGAIFGNTAVVKNRDTKRPHGFKINLDIHGQGDWIDFSCDVSDKMEMYEDYTLWVDNYNSIYVPSDIRILHNTTIYNAVPTVTNIQHYKKLIWYADIYFDSAKNAINVVYKSSDYSSTCPWNHYIRYFDGTKTIDIKQTKNPLSIFDVGYVIPWYPQIHGKYIIWTEMETTSKGVNSTETRIHLYDLSTNKETVVLK